MEGIKPEDIKFTPFTDGKIRVWFRMIDVGKDGYMCKDDFLSIADRFVKEYSLGSDKATKFRDWANGWFEIVSSHLTYDDLEYSLSGGKATEVRDWLVDGWNIVLDMDKHKESVEEMMKKMPLVVAMGNKVRSGARISEDEFTQAYGQLIEVYPQLAKESLEKMVGAFFEVFDEDSDCYITDAEMTSAMHCFGYDQPDLVKAAFASMDLDKDGKLSREEYVGGWVSFMLGQDKSNPFVKAFAPHLVEQ